MNIALLIFRLVLAAIFGVAGIAKLLDLKGSEKAVREFGMPNILAKPISILLPVAEVLIAVSLLFTETSWYGALAGTILLLLFVCGMVVHLAKGSAPDCHCFGQIHSEPVGAKSVIRNCIFAGAGIVLIIFGSENQGLNLFAPDLSSVVDYQLMQLILGIAIVCLLAAIVYLLKNISGLQLKILRRIEVLEVLSGAARDYELENLGHPDDGLPVGAPSPDFELPDVKGKNVAFEHLLAKAKPILMFFISPNCSPCNALLPEIKEWKGELGEKINFVFISSGKAKENLEKFGEVNDQILLQKQREVSEIFGAKWTPGALLVNSDGTIGSRSAAGDEAIRNLVEKVKQESKTSDRFYIADGGSSLQKSKIGEKVPEFEAEDLLGEKFDTAKFYDKKTLVAFWSETCPHCVKMLEDLRDWDRLKGRDEPNLVVFSTGDAEVHRNFELNSPIILDEGYKIAEKFGMSGTPSAVLVSEKGEIISETAIGAPQIWALIGKRK